MKKIKLPIALVIVIAGYLMIPTQAAAQWRVGATYELRDDTPQSGFGVRIEREIFRPIPIVDIGLRAHFSYFNEENDLSGGGSSISRDITTYDYGLAARAGVSVGIIKPYAGAGVGSNTFKVDTDDGSNSDSEFVWNGFAGVELTPVPHLNPFAEYRFQSLDGPEFTGDFESSGRFILGLIYTF